MALEIEARVRWPGWEKVLGAKDEHIAVGTGVAVYIPGGISRVLTSAPEVTEKNPRSQNVVLETSDQDVGRNESAG